MNKFKEVYSKMFSFFSDTCSQEKLETIDIKLIKTCPVQPRQHFDQKSIEELAGSIKEIGIIQPPVVREIKEGEFTYYELIAGERRVRAAKLAGLTNIVVLIRSDYNDDRMACSALIENIQRVDLNAIETALAFKYLTDTFNMTQTVIAERVGKKRSTVANYIRLLNLNKSIQKEIIEGNISVAHSKIILSLNNPEQQEELSQLIVDNKLNVRETEQARKDLLANSSIEQIKKTGDRFAVKKIIAKELALAIEDHLKIKVSVKTNGSAGSINIKYDNLTDLLHVLQALGVTIMPIF